MHTQKIFAVLLTAGMFFTSCKQEEKKADRDNAVKEIGQAEKDFEKMAAEKGIAEAFWFYADSNAVVKGRNDSLIKGREAIRNFFSADHFKTATVKWSPDFVDASESGDMGYTYGHYVWQAKDTAGRISESKGVFHTVWKKQADGSWKYTWD